MDLSQHWHACAELLQRYHHYWQTAAFKAADLSQLPVCLEQPQLLKALQALNDSELESLQGDDEKLLQFIQPHWPQAKAIAELIQVPAADALTPAINDARLKQLNQAIPGRKWQQLQAFSAALSPDKGNGEFIDCCCGKGHLSRFVAEQYRRPVLGLELDADLVEQARGLSTKLNLADCRFHRCDVLSADLRRELGATSGEAAGHLIALHACGFLHHSLLKRASENKLARISIAPCCYHKLFSKAQTHYPFLSQQAHRANFSTLDQLSFEHVRSSVRQAVTINARQRQQSQQLQAWRLGFDLLQRKLSSSDNYLNTPSVSSKLLTQGFEAFCRYLAEQKQLPLPRGIDYQHFEDAGRQRYAQVVRLDLVRMAFRRLLELCLVLDQACYLEEQGYRVELRRFCSTELTPRNLILNAWRQG